MPVTFKVADHDASPVKNFGTQTNLDDFLKSCAPKPTRLCSEIFQNSFKNDDLALLRGIRNGFVDTVIEAYNKHHHLVLRPDDIWMCILSQFSVYVNAHAEELRSHFVAHEGQEHIEIYCGGNKYTFPFNSVASQFTKEMDKFIVDKELKSWILPKFSTTTDIDTAAYAIQMMATLKSYFSYGISTLCGIPSVTLLGDRSDWQDLLERLPKLATFGPEPTQWANMLTPILSRFVEAFDGKPDIDFWGRVAHYYSMGSGPTYLSGWITAFCPWDHKGSWMLGKTPDPSVALLPPNTERSIDVKLGNSGWDHSQLMIDGQIYSYIDSSEVPHAYCDVPIRFNDNGEEFDSIVVAGLLACRTVPSDDGTFSTVQPAPGWFVFIHDTAQEEVLKEELAEVNRKIEAYHSSGKNDWPTELYRRQWELSAKVGQDI